MKATNKRSLFILFSAVLISLSTLCSVKTETVPFTIQNFLIILISCISGGLNGTGAAGIFLIAGTLGLPVFSLGSSGIQSLTGPTGGYLAGYFISSIVTGLIAGTPFTFEKKFRWKNYIKLFIAAAAGYLIISAAGLTGYYNYHSDVSGITFAKAFSDCIEPFIVIDIAKLAVTIPVAALLRPVAAKFLYPESESEEIFNKLKKINLF